MFARLSEFRFHFSARAPFLPLKRDIGKHDSNVFLRNVTIIVKVIPIRKYSISYSFMLNKKVIFERSVLDHLPGFNDLVTVL